MSAPTSRKTLVLGLFCMGLALLLPACQGPKGPSWAKGEYRDGRVAFAVQELPSSFRAVSMPHAVLAFRDDARGASVLLNARCQDEGEGTPLVALTNHLLMGTTERDVQEQALEPLDGREALHSVVTAKLDGVPYAFDVFVFRKDGCIYDFVHIAPASNAASAPEFRAFARSFRTLPPGVAR